MIGSSAPGTTTTSTPIHSRLNAVKTPSIGSELTGSSRCLRRKADVATA